MKVTFLGSGGSSVSAKRSCPCLLVDGNTLLDLGPGALRNLRSARLDTDRISTVLISHCHMDHISDLVPFLWTIQIDGRKNPLNVFGPLGFELNFRKLLECTYTPQNFFKFPLKVSDLKFGERFDEVQTCATVHSVPTLAFRIDSGGRSLCYGADTTYSSELIELAANVDLLVHESTFLEDQASIAELTKHSTARMAGEAGRKARAKKLALFHIPPPNEHREPELHDQASKGYGAEVIVGTDLATIEI